MITIEKILNEVNEFRNFTNKGDFCAAGSHLGLAIECFLECLFETHRLKISFYHPSVNEKIRCLQNKNKISNDTANKLMRCYSWRNEAVHGDDVNRSGATKCYELIKDVVWGDNEFRRMRHGN